MRDLIKKFNDMKERARERRQAWVADKKEKWAEKKKQWDEKRAKWKEEKGPISDQIKAKTASLKEKVVGNEKYQEVVEKTKEKYHGLGDKTQEKYSNLIEAKEKLSEKNENFTDKTKEKYEKLTEKTKEKYQNWAHKKSKDVDSGVDLVRETDDVGLVTKRSSSGLNLLKLGHGNIGSLDVSDAISHKLSQIESKSQPQLSKVLGDLNLEGNTTHATPSSALSPPSTSSSPSSASSPQSPTNPFTSTKNRIKAEMKNKANQILQKEKEAE